MGFEKLIIGQITGAAKNAFKMDIAVDEIKSTLIKTSSDQIEGKIPILLPFNTQDVLNNPSTLPPNLISTETISKTYRYIRKTIRNFIKGNSTIKNRNNYPEIFTSTCINPPRNRYSCKCY